MPRVDRSRPPHSDDFAANAEARTARGVLERLLDPAFGLMVWAACFLVVYCLAAVGCALGWVTDEASAWTGRLVLAGLTLAAFAVVAAHAFRVYRRDQPSLDHHFLMCLTIGHDAIAGLAILWLLLPLFLLPACR